MVEPVHVDRAALVSGRAELRGLVGGARDDHAALSRRELLVRIEGEGREVAAGAELHAVGIHGAGRLAGVLEHAEALRLGQRAQLGQRGRVAEDVDRQDAGGALPHRVGRGRGIEVQRHRVDVDEPRRHALVEQAVGRSDERERRGDDLVALAPAELPHAQVKRRGAGRNGHRIVDPKPLGELALEALEHRAQRQAPGAEHLQDQLFLALADLGLCEGYLL